YFLYYCLKKMSDSESTRQALIVEKFALKESIDDLAKQIQNLEASFKRRFQALEEILTQRLGGPNINNELLVR
ncbi:hypothetical protein ACMBCN_03255, partial [Candidatus Liberibacter asiaticus]|nr:hypothetical protein [Candidatus Liberibacter asiaticus]